MSLSDLLKKGALRAFATVTPATVEPEQGRTVAAVAAVAVARRAETAANEAAPDPDRWCWPASSAMNGAEIEIMVGRIARFTNKGLAHDEAEALADRLVLRDRDGDDRHSCFECRHLHGSGAWRCGNWTQAGVAVQANDAALGRDFTRLLRRCEGFTNNLERL